MQDEILDKIEKALKEFKAENYPPDTSDIVKKTKLNPRTVDSYLSKIQRIQENFPRISFFPVRGGRVYIHKNGESKK